MKLITTKTGSCITFVERNPNDITHVNWISIKSLDGCWSYVGKNYNKGEQEVSIQRFGCVTTDTVVHELMHALGFWHEQNRPDRDNYITVNFNNIEPENAYNFDKITADYFSTPYDYKSIMHYDEYSFSTNGEKTIIPKDPTVTIGIFNSEADILSKYDVQAVLTSYSCPRTVTTTLRPTTTTLRPTTTTLRPTTTTLRPTTTTLRPTTTTLRPTTTTNYYIETNNYYIETNNNSMDF